MKVAGFVLTGGRSTRMGRDKALLPLGGRTLCEQVGDALQTVAEEVFLIGHPERYQNLKYKCLPDLHPDLGPLSGLETALTLNLAEFNLVLSCDTFIPNPQWLQSLLDAAERGPLCAVAQDISGQLQPLCAVYRSGCRKVVSIALQQRRLRMLDLLQELQAHPVPVSGLLANLNTPEQYNEIVNAGRRV